MSHFPACSVLSADNAAPGGQDVPEENWHEQASAGVEVGRKYLTRGAEAGIPKYDPIAEVSETDGGAFAIMQFYSQVAVFQIVKPCPLAEF